MIAQALGALACLLAAGLLRQGWRRRTDGRRLLFAASGATFSAAAASFVASLGLSAGLIAALLLGGLAGFAVTFAARERRPHRAPPRRRAMRADAPTARRRGRAWARGSAAVLLTLATTEAVAAGLAAVLPGPAASRFAALVVVAPVLWAALIVWTLGDHRLRRPLIGMTGAIGASLALVATALRA